VDLLFAKLLRHAVLSVAQALAFVVVAWLIGTELPLIGPQTPHVLLAAVSAALLLGALGLLLSVYVKQLENFAGTMNFVIFPMYFMSTALYPLWKLEESGAAWVYQIARFNPFTHAVEVRSLAIVAGCLAAFFLLAAWGYDPQRGLLRRTGKPA
jgi:ABC-2 type transport system permease protein